MRKSYFSATTPIFKLKQSSYYNLLLLVFLSAFCLETNFCASLYAQSDSYAEDDQNPSQSTFLIRDTFIISDATDEIPIPPGSVYYFDTDDDYTLDRIKPLIHQFKKPSEDYSSNFKTYRWLHTVSKNVTDQDIKYYWNAKVDKIDVWIYKEGELYSYKTGFSVPLSEKTVQTPHTFWTSFIPIEIESNSYIEVFARAENVTRSSTYRGTFSIQQQEYALQQLQNKRLAIGVRNGFYLAFLFFGIIFSATYYYFTRESFSFYLALMCVFFSLVLLSINDYLYPFIPNYALFRHSTLILIMGGAQIMHYLFFRNYLNLKTNYPGWDRFFKWFYLLFFIVFIGLAVYTSITLAYGHALPFTSLFNITQYAIGLFFGLFLLRNRTVRNINYAIACLYGSVLGIISIILLYQFNREVSFVLTELQLIGMTLIIAISLTIVGWKEYINRSKGFEKIRESFVVNDSPAQQTRKDDNFEKLNGVILENLNNSQFSVEMLADELGVSTRTVGRIIKKNTGVSTLDWIINHRLDKAKLLLESGLGNSVKDVAKNVGYSNHSYFSKIYTEAFGKSPDSYF